MEYTLNNCNNIQREIISRRAGGREGGGEGGREGVEIIMIAIIIIRIIIMIIIKEPRDMTCRRMYSDG